MVLDLPSRWMFPGRGGSPCCGESALRRSGEIIASLFLPTP